MNWKDRLPKGNEYFKTKNGILYNQDNRIVLKQFPDNCIDLVITSPPYDNLRTYGKGIDKSWNFDVFKQVAQELARVIKVGGVIVWIVNDATINGSETGTSFRQALYFKDNCGLNLHDTMIYAKKNISFPSNNRYNQLFEYMFIFSKGKPKTFNPIKDVKNKRCGYKNSHTERQKDGSLEHKSYYSNNKYRKRSNIWFYAIGLNNTTRDKIAFKHPAVFPERLAYDHIVSWSNEGDIVLDPFVGSGTTAKQCEKLNRKWIGIELSLDYCEIIKKRIDTITMWKDLV